MSCTQKIPNFSRTCSRRMGGVRALLVCKREDITSLYFDENWTLRSEDEYIFNRIAGRGSFQTSAVVDETTGATYWRDELQFTPDDTDNEYLPALAILASAGPDDLVFVVETWNQYDSKIMGYTAKSIEGAVEADAGSIIPSPVFFSGGQYVSGTEKTDAHGQSFVLTSVHPLPALSFALSYRNASNPSTD